MRRRPSPGKICKYEKYGRLLIGDPFQADLAGLGNRRLHIRTLGFSVAWATEAARRRVSALAQEDGLVAIAKATALVPLFSMAPKRPKSGAGGAGPGLPGAGPKNWEAGLVAVRLEEVR